MDVICVLLTGPLVVTPVCLAVYIGRLLLPQDSWERGLATSVFV